MWAVGAILVGRAVGVDLSLLEALFAASVINLGVAIPSSPGFVGTYQWLAVAALGLFDVPREQALAFAILMQAVWYIPTTLAAAVLLGGRAVQRAGQARQAREQASFPAA
jgi:glycosyltransferase 2 family protein